MVTICLCGLSKNSIPFAAKPDYKQTKRDDPKCALIHDDARYMYDHDIENMNTRVIVEYPAKLCWGPSQ